jgi:hypothetical protein
VLANLINEKILFISTTRLAMEKKKGNLKLTLSSSAWIYAIPVEKGDNCLNWLRIFKVFFFLKKNIKIIFFIFKKLFLTIYQNNIKK